MKQWKKFFNLAVLATAFFALNPSNVSADYYDNCCDPCDSCDNCGFTVGADFLWWNTNADDLSYCAVRDESDVKRKNFCLDWEPGFRVYIGKQNIECGLDLAASYTYLNTCDSASTSDSGDVIPTFTHPGFTISVGNFDEGKGSWESTYHEWDVLLSFDNSCNQCHKLSHFFGVAGIVLDQEFTATVEKSSSIIHTKWDNDYWGVGLRFGTHYSRVICDCFSIFASGHASIIAGESDSKIDFDSQNLSTDPDHVFKEDKECRIVPGYHITTGFSYDTCVCDWDLSFRIGYEFLAWFNVPERRTYVADGSIGSSQEAALATSSNNRTLGFHGLFVGAQLSF